MRRYSERLLARIRTMLGDSARRYAESGDFLQGVFVDVLENFDQFEPRDEGAFMRWAAQIARNNIRDAVRRPHSAALRGLAQKMEQLRPEGRWPSREILQREAQQRLRACLDEIGQDQQLVVMLRDFDGLSFAAIAERMGRSANACQILHARALVKLSELMER